MADTQEQLLTELTTVDPTDFIRIVDAPTTTPNSGVIQKSKFVDNLFGDIITPVTNGAVNDWAPSGITTAHIIRIFPSGPTTISGITSGALGRILILFNVSTSLVTLLDDSSLSTAANRIQITGTGNDYQLPADAGVMLAYDTTTSRWRLIGATTLADGWNPLGSFFTFVSVDGSTTVVTTTIDVTGRIQKGYRLRYAQNLALSALWTFDASSVSNVGSFTATDTAMTYTAGKFSNAATFNGTTSKIVITDNATLKPTGEFTLGLWVKCTVSGSNQRIFQSYSANTAIAGIHVSMTATTGTLTALFGKNTGTTANVDYSQLTGTKNIGDNTWHYVVLAYRNNYLQMYIDGALEMYGYMYTPAYAATNYIQFGMGNNTGADVVPLNGQIDDVFFINGYALDEATIRAKYLTQAAQSAGGYAVTKYGIVTDISWNGTLTTITFWGGTDFAGVSGSMGTPYYSPAKVPFGFNASPKKWSVLVTYAPNALQVSPAVSTLYNLGGVQITMPIGVWYSKMYATMYLDRGTAATMAGVFGLTTSLSAVSDITLTGEWAIGTISLLQQPVFIESAQIIALTKTLYYFFGQTTTTTVVNMIAKNIVIQFICAYL